mmetsp:Transcript_34200/g.86513  ORF Transcript_34200/g.86513 Transcript_34200/m.86513 type:complete len:234 (+) Transcript_34200:140-841(+)
MRASVACMPCSDRATVCRASAPAPASLRAAAARAASAAASPAAARASTSMCTSLNHSSSVDAAKLCRHTMLPSSMGLLASNRRQLYRLYVAYTSTGGMPSARETAAQGTASTGGSDWGGPGLSHHMYAWAMKDSSRYARHACSPSTALLPSPAPLLPLLRAPRPSTSCTGKGGRAASVWRSTPLAPPATISLGTSCSASSQAPASGADSLLMGSREGRNPRSLVGAPNGSLTM